jgi:hypothetical protein
MAGTDRHWEEVTTLTLKHDGFRARLAVPVLPANPGPDFKGNPQGPIIAGSRQGSLATSGQQPSRQGFPVAKPATGFIVDKTILFVQSYKQ